MELQKTPINISFRKGEDTKTDPYQVQADSFLALNDSVFDSLGRLTKRNGLGFFASSPGNSPKSLATFGGALTSIGSNVSAYTPSGAEWTSKGNFKSCSLTTQSMIRNNSNQVQTDVAVLPSGVACVVYTQTADYITFTYSYSIVDSTNGQPIVAPAALPSANGAPRVFILGSNFIIVYPRSANSLYYLPISTAAPFTASAATLFVNDYAPSTSGIAFDGVVSSGNLYLAYAYSSTGLRMVYLSAALSISAKVTPDASHTPYAVGVWSDETQVPPTVWVGYASSTVLYALAESTTLTPILAATNIGTVVTARNITGYAQAAAATVLAEQASFWAYDTTAARSNLIYQPVTQAGSVGTTYTKYNVGLGSKGFLISGNGYVMSTYASPYQSTYFLLDSSGNVITKVAYGNGFGYYYSGGISGSTIPAATVNGSAVSIPYLYKSTIQPVSKATNSSSPTAGIFSQYGINIANIDLSNKYEQSIEAGSNLNIAGGFLWSFDGTAVTENNFFLFPEFVPGGTGTINLPAQSTSTTTITGTTTIGSYYITSPSTTTSVYAGMAITGTNVGAGALVKSVTVDGSGNNVIIMTVAATGSSAGTTLTLTPKVAIQTYYYSFTYEWTDNQGNIFRSAPSIPLQSVVSSNNSIISIYVPYLTLTYKTANPVKIVGYRWSQGQPVYYQFTSIAQPILNNLNAQGVTVTDANSDANILGNSILYTTGGVVEDISPPSTDTMALFDTRVWLVDSEDKNLLWFSKQVIEGAPLEFSDLLTYYVPPIIGAQGNAGPVRSYYPIDDKLALFRANSIQYINGVGPDNTGANNQYSQPIYVSSPVGCSNQRSIVMTPQGLMFQSDNGIWLLGRDMSVTYIGAPVQQYNSYVVASAQTIPGTTQVRFTLSGGPTLMYDYFVSQWGVFSANGNNYVSSTVYNGLHTLLESGGTVYQETPGTYVDGATPVAMSFTTAWIQPAGLRGYQRAYFMYYLGTYLSSHQIQTQIAYDYDSTIVQTDLITPDSTQSIEQQRVFLAKQKCKSFQVVFTEVVSSAGAGLTLSGISLIVGLKKGYAPIEAARSVG